MFENLDMFRLSAAMARHAGDRQALTAENIANADTPGYRAKRMDSFADRYRTTSNSIVPLRTRAGHIGGAGFSAGAGQAQLAQTEGSPNGNAVSIEQEMVQAVDNQREHDRAIAIYKHGLTILRSALGR